MREDYFTTAAALQRHETNVLTAYRREMAEFYRQQAAVFDAEALATYEPLERERLEGIAEGLRVAAVRVDVPEEVTA